jgi:hypothetical protein
LGNVKTGVKSEGVFKVTEKRYRVIPCCPCCGSVNYRVRTRTHDHRCGDCKSIFKKCAMKETILQKVRQKFFKIKKAEGVTCDAA